LEKLIKIGLIEIIVPMCGHVKRVNKQKQNSFIHSIDLKTKFMATTTTNSHSGKHRSDHEIEKYRLELNWTKILDKLKSAKVSGWILF
jgi:hypothetical protein